MNPLYRIDDPAQIYSPALIFFRDLIDQNLQRMIAIAGGAEHLRPHVKTHKTREILKLELSAGIRKHKCATIAEAELAASVGVEDILLAYPMVGPNCERLAKLVAAYPRVLFSVLVDHPISLGQLSSALTRHGQKLEVLLDVNVGQNRTGIAVSPEARALYQHFAKTPGVRPGGLHVYDGHNHQEDLNERRSAVNELLEPVLQFRDDLEKAGLPVPRLVLGGTPTFTVWADLKLPKGELSPGTCVLHDHGYGSHFPEMGFVPAAILLTRVVSKPTPGRLTFDLGYKAVASDPPAGSRLVLLDMPHVKQVLQNEEHLVIETPEADRYQPGDLALAIPIHICPTCALHRSAHVIQNGKLVGQWDIVGRDRALQF